MVTSPSSVLASGASFPTWWAILLIIVGFFALALPFEAGVAIAIAVAVLVIIAGVLHLAGTFAARSTAHVRDWRARKATQRDQRSTSRNGNRQWGARACRYRRSSGKRKSAGNWSTDGERGCHRRTRHVRDWGTRGRTRRTGRTGRTGCSGSCWRSGLACRPVHACGAARFQRSRYCARAQRYRGTA